MERLSQLFPPHGTLPACFLGVQSGNREEEGGWVQLCRLQAKQGALTPFLQGLPTHHPLHSSSWPPFSQLPHYRAFKGQACWPGSKLPNFTSKLFLSWPTLCLCGMFLSK